MDINRIRELAGITVNEKVAETKATQQFGNIKLYEEMKFKKLANSLGATASINENTSITVGVVSFEETTIEESKQKLADFAVAWENLKAGKTITEAKGTTYVLYVGEKGSGKLGQQFSDDSSTSCHQEFKDSWSNEHDKDGKKIKYVHKVVAVKDGETAPTQLDESEADLNSVLDILEAVKKEEKNEKETDTTETSKEESEESSEKNDCDEGEKEEVKEGFDSLKSVAAEYKALKSQGNKKEADATYRELIRLAGSEAKAKDIINGKEVVAEGMDDSKVISYEDAAEILGVTASRVSQLVMKGELTRAVLNNKNATTIGSVEAFRDFTHPVKESDNNFVKKHSENKPNLEAGIHDADDLNDRMGIKQEREKKIAVPAEIKSSVANRIKELKASIAQYDEKGYNDHSQKEKAIECLEKIMDNLALGNVEGLKQAQIFFGTLMSPITDLFPSNLITFLANAKLTWLDKLK